MSEAIVTTGVKAREKAVRTAKEIAQLWQLSYIERERKSLTAMRDEYGAGYILISRADGLFLDMPDGTEFFFHTSMAHLRVKNIRLGRGDKLLEAMELHSGMSVLDCTLGLGSDAIVASFASGSEGKVTALEKSPLIAAVISHGLSSQLAENYPLQEAMRRIKVINADYLDYLRLQPSASVDIVYFDPMFRHPLQESASIKPLRPLADKLPVSSEAIAEAVRVARRRVVLKENSRSQEFARLGFVRQVGGKYSHVRYGIIDV